MTQEIKKALEEVRKFHPTVTTVVFNKYGQWNYCDDNFDSPVFSDEIDVSILEEASDSVPILPYVCCISVYQIYNILEDKYIFEGDERELIDFTKLIAKENEDIEYSVLGISDAIEYIEDYCENLEITN